MENLNQIESEILNKIENVKDRNAYDIIKSQIFGKKGIITELFKKIGTLDQSDKKKYGPLNFSFRTKPENTNNGITNPSNNTQIIQKTKKAIARNKKFSFLYLKIMSLFDLMNS